MDCDRKWTALWVIFNPVIGLMYAIPLLHVCALSSDHKEPHTCYCGETTPRKGKS